MIKTRAKQPLRRRLHRKPASPLFVFGLSAAISLPAQAGDIDALPRDPSVAAGGASFAQSGRTLTVNQTTGRVVIDWRSFDIGANAQTNFNQPNSGSIAVNRIGTGTDPTRIDGGLSANGQVWILNPNGVLFGSSARVNAAGIVASTANIDASRFMAGDNRLLLTGQDSGMVANDGHISVSESGLAAFVAPSVRNNGVITARAGKVTLAAGTTFTLDLAGDHLIEIGLGANKAVVDQSGKIVNPGGMVKLSARAASAVVDGAINMSGVIRTASARRAGGAIILDADTVTLSGTADASGASGGSIAITAKTVDVLDSAILRADGRGNGSGGTIIAVATGRAGYAGQYTARGGAAGGDGGKIETSGEHVSTAPTIKVDASAPGGKAGEWLIDPLNITISAGNGGGLTGATVTAGAIQTTLAGGTSVAITTAQGGADAGDLTLAGTINATSTGNAGLTLTGRRLQATGNSVINIAGGALTLNVNTVNANSTPPSGGWINDALGMIGTVSGGSTINLGAGIYTMSSGYINVNKSNLTLNGAGQGLTILDARNASTYGLRVTATSDVTLNGFTLYGATGTNAYGLKAEATSNLTLNNITSQGAAKSEFDLNGIIGGTLTNLTANGAAATGAGFTSGAPTAGNGISLTDSQNITLRNSTTMNNQWGGLALYQSNFSSGYAFQEKDITVAASNNFTEANPIYAEDQSATNDFGALTLSGYNYVVQAPGSPSDVYSWFQKTQQAAIDYAANNNANATVQDYAGNGQAGNNIFSIGTGTLTGGGTRALSIPAAISAARTGATINILSGAYTLSTQLNIAKSLSLVGAGIDSTTLTSNSTGYGINVTADNVRLSGFTFNAPTAVGNATYGIKITPDTNVRSDRLLNFAIDHVRINGGYRTGLDLHGVVGATIDNISVANVVRGNGIALTDSANVTITNATTSNNAWGGLALYQSKTFYDQKIDNISVNASNNFNEVIPVYAEDQSATQDVGTLALAGFSFVVKSPNLANDVYTWFQKTARAAVDFATNAALSNNNLNLATATVQAYGGTGVQGNNVFTVGIGSNGTAMSISTAIAAAASGAIVNLLDGTYVIPGSAPYLNVNKSLSLIGQSQAGTTIDAHAASQYGLRVTADNVSLSNFTLLGATAAGNSYGIKVENNTDPSPSARISNFSISNVTSHGARKAQLDMNGVVGATIDRFTADGTSNGFGPGSQAGAGIAISDSANITITNSSTNNNAYGGLALYQTNIARNQQVTGITVAASNAFQEAVPVYMEDTSASLNFGAVNIAGFDYMIADPANAADLFTFFQKTQQGAVNYAASRGAASYIQGWTGTAGNNVFTVGVSTGGTALSIQAAIDAATPGAVINIASGSYSQSVTQNIRATVNFGTVILGGSYTLNSGAANSTLSGSLSAAAINWNAPVNLGGALSLNTSTANGAIAIAAINGGQALTLNAGAGSISLGNLGATTRLGAVNALSNTTLTGNTYSAASLNFARDLTLTAQTTLDTSTVNGAITIAAINGGQALTLNAGAGAISLGNLGATTRLGAVNALSSTTLTGNTYNAASLNFARDLTLTAAQTSLDTSVAGGAISIAAINGGQALTLNAGAGTISLGALGATTGLGATNALSNTILTGDSYNAASLNFARDVILTAAQTRLDTSAAGGDITVAGTLRGSLDGAQSVTLRAGSGSAAQNGDIALQNVGASGLALGSMTVAGNNFSAQTVNLAGDFNSTLTGNQVFSSNTLNARGLVRSAVGGNASGPINAGGAVGLSVGGQLSGSIGGSNIDLNAGTIQGATVNATQAVTISAITVSGSTLNAQTVSATATNFNTNVNAASVTLDAGTITGSTIIGSSGIAIKAKSVQGSSLAAPTVTATADNFNTSVTASSSARISGIDVGGTFSGGSFTVSGTNSVNANMSTNSASVSGGTIAGTYTGNAVSLTGSTSVNATVTSKTLSVQSPSGNLQGSWASVDTGSSGTLLLNKQANISGDVGPSQLVVENFVLPRRSAVTARGDILLPQNLSLGLLSPAGAAAPTFVVVQTVQQLGTLLSQNYSAIVIDLGGTARKDRATD